MKRVKHRGPLTAAGASEDPPPLSPQRAFVVQFRVGTGATPTHFVGRIEHMISGQAGHFGSVEELVTFFTQILAEVQD